MRDVKLARNWSKTRVLECLEKGQKNELVRFLDERYSERFFNPINYLRNAPGNEQGYGFAIMALCSLLVETLQGFRDGLPNYYPRSLKEMESKYNGRTPDEYKLVGPFDGIKSDDAFKDFFNSDPSRKHLPEVDGDIYYTKIRCGLLHQAQTEDGWRLIRTGKFWDREQRSINREEFAERLEGCFRDYLKELDEHPWARELWMGARKKIWWLAMLS